MPGDTLGLPKHPFISGSTNVEEVVAPMTTIGISWASESILQILICRLIQEDKIVVVTTQGENKNTELERLKIIDYCKGIDQVYHAVRGGVHCLAPRFS